MKKNPATSRAFIRPQLGAIAFCLSVTGCTTLGPDYIAPAAPLQAEWISPAIPPSREEAATEVGFWAQFGDEQLVALQAHALRKSPDLRGSLEQVVQAREQLRITRGSARPEVQLSGGPNYTQPDTLSALSGEDDGSTTHQFLGQSSWEIDFWGKQRRAIEGDQAALLSSEAAFSAATVSLAASVASAYCDMRVIERRLAVAKANAEQQAENARIAEARFRLGASSELDWRQAQTQLEQTKAQIPELQASLEYLQHGLSVLVGETPDFVSKEIIVTGELPGLPDALPVGAPRDLLRARADVREAEMAAAAQSARIGQAQAALYPTFTLNGSFGFVSTTGAGDLFNWDNRAISRGAGFYLPIFDRGRLVSQVKVQDSLFAQAVLAYQSRVLSAQKEVEDALASIRNGNQRLDGLRLSETAAQRSAQLALIRYRSGQTDYTTVSSAEQSRLQTSDAVVQAQGELLQAYISAYRALGGGWNGTSISDNRG